jgi:hypothetical protein
VSQYRFHGVTDNLEEVVDMSSRSSFTVLDPDLLPHNDLLAHEIHRAERSDVQNFLMNLFDKLALRGASDRLVLYNPVLTKRESDVSDAAHTWAKLLRSVSPNQRMLWPVSDGLDVSAHSRDIRLFSYDTGANNRMLERSYLMHQPSLLRVGRLPSSAKQIRLLPWKMARMGNMGLDFWSDYQEQKLMYDNDGEIYASIRLELLREGLEDVEILMSKYKDRTALAEQFGGVLVGVNDFVPQEMMYSLRSKILMFDQ